MRFQQFLPHILAILVVAVVTSDALAMLHPRLGRYMQRGQCDASVGLATRGGFAPRDGFRALGSSHDNRHSATTVTYAGRRQLFSASVTASDLTSGLGQTRVLEEKRTALLADAGARVISFIDHSRPGRTYFQMELAFSRANVKVHIFDSRQVPPSGSPSLLSGTESYIGSDPCENISQEKCEYDDVSGNCRGYCFSGRWCAKMTVEISVSTYGFICVCQ